MNCYSFEVHFPDFEDLVYEVQHLTNLVVSHHVYHLCSHYLLDLQDRCTVWERQHYTSLIIQHHLDYEMCTDLSWKCFLRYMSHAICKRISHLFCPIFFDFSAKPYLWLWGTLVRCGAGCNPVAASFELLWCFRLLSDRLFVSKIMWQTALCRMFPCWTDTQPH